MRRSTDLFNLYDCPALIGATFWAYPMGQFGLVALRAENIVGRFQSVVGSPLVFSCSGMSSCW